MLAETLRSVCLLKLSIYRQCPVIDCLANHCTVHTTNVKSYGKTVLASLSTSSYLGFPLSGFQTVPRLYQTGLKSIKANQSTLTSRCTSWKTTAHYTNKQQ